MLELEFISGSHISRGDIFRPSVLFLLFAHIAFYAVSM